MNRYILIRRLRAPAVLLLIGVLALLHQMGVIDHFWHLFWPLLFILIGAILLAERAVLSIDSGNAPPYPGGPLPSSPYPGAPYAGAPAATTSAPESAMVPTHSHDFDNDPNGGHS
jgi:Domain of unknown function (DUF5668)